MIKYSSGFKTLNIFAVVLFLCLIIAGDSFAQDINHDQHHKMNDSTLMHRQHMIHANSPMVMPFDMDKATHYFLKNSSGGVLKIKAKDPDDSTQIALIRSHLKKEQVLFSKADFGDPETLHGADMPGLKTLTGAEGKFNVEYKELIDGAQLTFTSGDEEVKQAIHAWFDAQLKDHGSDAKSRE
jgi:hypothetical protein